LRLCGSNKPLCALASLRFKKETSLRLCAFAVKKTSLRLSVFAVQKKPLSAFAPLRFKKETSLRLSVFAVQKILSMENAYIHETACVDEGSIIGEGTKIWHFCHIMSGARIGINCVLGQNVFVGGKALIGNNVKIQNNVSVYDSVEIGDDVFCGPSCVFTNVINPRAYVHRKDEYQKTIVEKGVTIGANATIVCGVRLGRFCFIGAGAVVTHNVKPYALMTGIPARQSGWVSRYGVKLDDKLICPETGQKYALVNGQLEMIDYESQRISSSED